MFATGIRTANKAVLRTGTGGDTPALDIIRTMRDGTISSMKYERLGEDLGERATRVPPVRDGFQTPFP
jgi:hypothetical protein